MLYTVALFGVLLIMNKSPNIDVMKSIWNKKCPLCIETILQCLDTSVLCTHQIYRKTKTKPTSSKFHQVMLKKSSASEPPPKYAPTRNKVYGSFNIISITGTPPHFLGKWNTHHRNQQTVYKRLTTMAAGAPSTQA